MEDLRESTNESGDFVESPPGPPLRGVDTAGGIAAAWMPDRWGRP